MGRLIERHGRLSLEGRRRGPRPNPFAALISIVTAQQVSGSAADAIDARLSDAFDGSMPTPEQAIRSPRKLRDAGLSARKVEYVQGIARAVRSGELDPDELGRLPDEEVTERLVEIRGLGTWSAEMYLISYLERPDVLSGGDLGIRRGVQTLLDREELPSPQEVVEIGERWRPHRTLASFYLWREARRARRS